VFKSQKNQDFFCELFGLDCTYGPVSINKTIPQIIKQKLTEEPDFLFSLHSMDKFRKGHESQKNYWSFPDFKEISTAVLNQ